MYHIHDYIAGATGPIYKIGILSVLVYYIQTFVVSSYLIIKYRQRDSSPLGSAYW